MILPCCLLFWSDLLPNWFLTWKAQTQIDPRRSLFPYFCLFVATRAPHRCLCARALEDQLRCDQPHFCDQMPFWRQDGEVLERIQPIGTLRFLSGTRFFLDLELDKFPKLSGFSYSSQVDRFTLLNSPDSPRLCPVVPQVQQRMRKLDLGSQKHAGMWVLMASTSRQSVSLVLDANASQGELQPSL